jgi:hypothetical protein
MEWLVSLGRSQWLVDELRGRREKNRSRMCGDRGFIRKRQLIVWMVGRITRNENRLLCCDVVLLLFAKLKKAKLLLDNMVHQDATEQINIATQR